MKRFSLRIPDDVHDAMVAASRRNRRSLNDEILVAMERHAEGEGITMTVIDIEGALRRGDYETIYHQADHEYEALRIPWDDVTAILGRPHRGDGDDDASIVQALESAGAPSWVSHATGWVDEQGWGLIGPEIND